MRTDLIGSMHAAQQPHEKDFYQRSLSQSMTGPLSQKPFSSEELKSKACRRQKVNNEITRICEHDDVFDIIQQKPIFQGKAEEDTTEKENCEI